MLRASKFLTTVETTAEVKLGWIKSGNIEPRYVLLRRESFSKKDFERIDKQFHYTRVERISLPIATIKK